MEERQRTEKEAAAKVLHILLLEDSPLDAELIVTSLTDGGIECQLHRVETRGDFLAALEQRPLDVILGDYSLPAFDGISALELAHERCPDVPFIFVSGAIGEELAIETLKCGATDYVLKQRLARLVPSVRRALEETAERDKRKRAEQELARTRGELAAQLAHMTCLHAELREADRSKDEFLAMLAHELRNPIVPILSAAELMRMRGLVDPALERARDTIERQALQLARLLDDLLDVSRITRGTIELRTEAVDVARVLADAVQASRSLIDRCGHQLVISFPAKPLHVEVDPTRLAQVFTNLLNNAAKYTEPAGHISLSADREETQAVIRVRDTGVGIAPEMLSRVFDLFTQVDHSLARSKGGLGIGLTLVRSLIQIHGGTVTAHSAGLGRGSEFVVRLPLTTAPAIVRRADAGPLASAGRRIVLVEDSADAREMLRQLLGLSGHHVEVAEDGPSGLETIRRCHPDVALIDIGLPGLDGYQVAEQVRAGSDGRDIFLVALTGYSQPADHRRASAAGFDAYLVKPVKLDELTRLMAR